MTDERLPPVNGRDVDVTTGGSAHPPAESVREQLIRVLHSQLFAQAPMLQRLLTHLVNQSLAGEELLKEYSIGVDVFDRGADFDPRVDTIVRVQARRLRVKVADYYRSEGAADPVLITLPRGRYQVECQVREVGGHPRAGDQMPESEERSSIVVLPFVNLNADAETEFLTDGLTEELIGTLASVTGLKVVARTSAFHFKGCADDIRRIGQELGVRTALEGSVRIHQQRIRVMAQLIDLASGLHLWSDSYDRTSGSVFEIQQDIAGAIVDALRLQLTRDERARLRPAPPSEVEAYDEYLRGRYYWHKLSPADLRRSIEHLKRAVTLAPAYATAHAGLAESYVSFAGIQTEAPRSHLELARQAAQRALALEPSAEAHAAMGAVLALADFNWRDSEREFRHALALKPSFATGRAWYATACLCPLRQYRQAVDELHECLSVDPLSVVIRVMLGQTLVLAAEFDAAESELRHALAVDPTFTFAHVTLGLAQLGAGALHEARQTLVGVEGLAADFPSYWGCLGYIHAKLGEKAEAEQTLQELVGRFEPWVPCVDAAAVYNALGDTTRALEFLERARRDRSFDSLFIADDPRLLNLASSPAFAALLSPSEPRRRTTSWGTKPARRMPARPER